MFKLRYLLLPAFISFWLCGNAQEQLTKKNDFNGFVKFGPGYYMNVFDGLLHGQTLWAEAGYKLPNDLIVSVGFMYSKANDQTTNDFILGNETFYFYQDYSLNFSYEFDIKDKHKFTPGIGLVYDIMLIPRFDAYVQNGKLYLGTRVLDDQELGINVNLDYHYELSNKLFFGVRASGTYLISIGFDHLVLSPIIGVKF